jgi:hypothetical protein
MSSLAAMAATFIRKVYNGLHGYEADHILTIPIGIDSQSAIDAAQSNKETQRTRVVRALCDSRLQIPCRLPKKLHVESPLCFVFKPILEGDVGSKIEMIVHRI